MRLPIRLPQLKKMEPLKFWLLIGLSLMLILVVGVAALRTWYSYNLRPVSTSTAIRYFTVISGSGVDEIGAKLERNQLIRSSQAFETYVRSHELHNSLQAGTYSLSQSMSVEEIVTKMVEGDVAKNLLTILPAKRLDQIKETFVKAGYSPDAVNAAFNPALYQGHPALASLPAGASLEGYLYPDSFQKEADTPPDVIVRKSLDEMNKHLTPKLQAGLASQGFDVFKALTMASIILQETDDPEIQPVVAQVFLTRLARNMPLESDPTAFYASAVAGKPKDLRFDSPYNTYLHPGLPPGPIGNVTIEALRAAANPAKTDYLFFVAGDDGKVHFSHTKEQHQEAINKYCRQKCGRL